MTAPAALDVHVITHTHWDREWYLPAGRFRQRLVALIDALLAESSAPGVSFLLDGQAVVLEDYLAVRREMRAELAERLRNGQLEAGPWYVLADELIPSGEALVRNLLLGRRILRELGAAAPPVLYSPDAFGHPAALPTLAAGFGYPFIVLWRGLGGEGWPDGDSFRWRGPDGAEVLVHHLPPAGYEFGSNLPTGDDDMAARWAVLHDTLASRARLGAVLVLNGADHHAKQPSEEAAFAALRRAAAPHRVVRSSLRAFAADMVRRAARVTLPCLEGELRSSPGYTWSLQGTFGTRGHLKRRNAHVERLLLREAEPWAAVAARRGAPLRGPLLRAAWKVLLQCHPHDTLCGCSSDEVARATAARLDDAEAQAAGVRDDALIDLVGHDPVAARTAPERWRSVVILRNPAPMSRGGIAELEVAVFRQHVPVGPGSGVTPPLPAGEMPFTLGGGQVPYQVLESSVRHDRVESPVHYPDDDLVQATRVIAWVESVDGYGTRALPVDLGAANAVTGAQHAHVALLPGDSDHRRRWSPLSAGTNWIENGTLRVEIDVLGGVRLRAHRSGLDLPSLLRFEDVGDAGDLYTHSGIGPLLTDAELQGVRLRHAGPLRAELVATWRLDVPVASSRSGRALQTVSLPIEATISLDVGAPFVRLRLRGENLARDHRLRVVFWTGVHGPMVYADAAFGPVRRDVLIASARARAMEQPAATAPLARYVTLANATGGATLFSDGLREYETTPDGEVAVTLVRSVGELSRDDLPERPGHAGWPVSTPEAQSLGPFAGSFALMPHGPRDEATIVEIERAADDVLLPLTGLTLRSALHVSAPTAGITLEGDGLALFACKESEDGAWIVLRCVNLLERAVRGRWRLGVPATEARLARLDETPVAPLAVDDAVVEFDAAPRGVVTVLVR